MYLNVPHNMRFVKIFFSLAGLLILVLIIVVLLLPCFEVQVQVHGLQSQ